MKTETNLRNNHATNFRFLEMKDLLKFLNDWMELEVSRFFQLTIRVSNEQGIPHVIQAVPNGTNRDLDVTFFELLDASFEDGMLHEWKSCVANLPRIEP